MVGSALVPWPCCAVPACVCDDPPPSDCFYADRCAQSCEQGPTHCTVRDAWSASLELGSCCDLDACRCAAENGGLFCPGVPPAETLWCAAYGNLFEHCFVCSDGPESCEAVDWPCCAEPRCAATAPNPTPCE